MAIRKISSRSLGDTAVATADIADGQITSAKLDNSITIDDTLTIAGGTAGVGGETIRVGDWTDSSKNYGITIQGADDGVSTGVKVVRRTAANGAGTYTNGVGWVMYGATKLAYDTDFSISKYTNGVGYTPQAWFADDGIRLGTNTSSNALDDYEEGTFSMQMSDSNSGSETLYMSYVKIGRMVHVTGPWRTSEGYSSETYWQLSGTPDSNITVTSSLPFTPSISGGAISVSHRNLERRTDGASATTGDWLPVLAWSANSTTLVLTDTRKESSYYAAVDGNTLRKADNRTNVVLQFNFTYLTAS